MIEFHLDERSGVAPYQQLVRQTRHALRLGMLREGDQLPTVKEVVGSLAINPNTVLKAYRELERDGVVKPRPGVGTFVTASLPDTSFAAGWPKPAGRDSTTRASRLSSPQPFVTPPRRT